MMGLILPAAVSGETSAPRFIHLSVEQGLSQSTVQVILQDHIGFLWFGTTEGLNRYDGHTFVVFKHDPKNAQSLPNNIVTRLHEGKQERLWVGTESGLSLFDRRTETFTRVPNIHTRVTGIVEDPDGTLWVGTMGEGLFQVDPNKGTFVSYLPDSVNSASLVSRAILTLLRDRSGRLWIGTSDGGVDLFDRNSNRFVHHRHDPRDPKSLVHDEVWGLAQDVAGNLWVATYGGGLSVLDHKTGLFRHYRQRPGEAGAIRTNLLTCLFADQSVQSGSARTGRACRSTITHQTGSSLFSTTLPTLPH